MPFIKLNFKPGVNRDQTNYSNEGGWYACDKIRFRSGFPQKLGGWLEYTVQRFLGVCRQMFAWTTTFTDNFVALGTNEKVYIEVGGYFYDITPLRSTTAAGDVTFAAGYSTLSASMTPASLTIPVTSATSFAPSGIVLIDSEQIAYTGKAGNTLTGLTRGYNGTTPASHSSSTLVGSYTITVSDTAFGSVAGDYVTFSGATSLGGNITAAVLNQNYQIATRINANSYTITAKNPTTGAPVSANASDSGNGGASVIGAYEIPVGYALATQGYGWGTSGWNGAFGWGLSSPTPVNLPQQDWWFDNFDNDLVINQRNGAIYYWVRGATTSPSTALATRAVLLSSISGATDVPAKAFQIAVSQNDKHLLAFGCTPYGGGNADPLLIRWANQDEPTNWTPAVTNSAGFLRISRGSQIVAVNVTRQEILVFTEATLYSLQYLGTTDVFGLQQLADNISVISPRATVTANNVTFWMGFDKFYAYSGRVETLPCTLRNHVFNDINYAQTDQIISGTNEGWNEVWWLYPSANSNTVNKYVIYNHLERIWYYGTIDRTAWLDSSLRSYPQSAGYGGIMYDQERGLNDNGSPMTSYIQSSDFDIADGEQYMLSRRIIPDLSFDGSTAANPEATFTITPRNFPGSSYQTDPSDAKRVIESSIDSYTNQIFIRARARQMALKVTSTALDTQWQLGSPRLDARVDGKQ